MLALNPGASNSSLATRAAKAAAVLGSVTKSGRRQPPKNVVIKAQRDQTVVQAEVPFEIFELFVGMLNELAQGRAVTILPDDRELTTQEVADMLNVSRPYVVTLLEGGKLPFRRVGTRRRVRLADAIDYKKRDEAGRRRIADELAREAEESGLEY
jgi:excisionase family DNA binding protein